MQTAHPGATRPAAATSRVADLYDPRRTFDVRWRDVEYRRDGSTSRLARIYEPQCAGPFPALLEVHGGAWNHNDRTQNSALDEALAASGLVVAAIDFRLGTEAAYPASIADVNYATRWLKAHAGDFNATAEGLGGLGLSSGGHMVILSAMRPRDPRYTELPLDAVPDVDASLAYVMSGWGVLDPHARYLYAKGLGRESLVTSHHNYFVDEDGMQEANPQLILERGESVELPPALLVQGGDESILSPRTAEDFASAYSKAGGLIELALYPRADHGYAREPGPNTERTLDLMKSFVARQLRAIDQGW
jgi:acetyl esterase/lipase